MDHPTVAPSLSYAKGPPLPTTAFDSCWKQMNDACERNPEKVAIISMHQAPDLYGKKSLDFDFHLPRKSHCLRWRYRDLQSGGVTLAKALSSQGAGIDTPVFTFVPNGIEYVLILWACAALGARFVPLNSRNLANETELNQMVDIALRDTNSAVTIVMADSDSTAKIDGIERLKTARRFVIGHGDKKGWVSFNVLMQENSEHIVSRSILPPHLAAENTDSALFFTSGTTSLPKGIHLHYPHMPSAVIASNAAAGKRYTYSPRDIIAIVGPNNHLLCYLFLMAALSAGAVIVFPSPAFDADAFVTSMEQEKVTHTAVVPTMVQQIAAAKTKLGRPVQSHLQNITMGGSGVSREIMKVCVEDLGSQGVQNIYGSTEGVLQNSGCHTPEYLARGSNTSIGTCKPGCQLKVCAPGSRDPVPRGQAGELHFQSESLAEGYIDLHSDDFYVADGDRWMGTGDQAIMYEDGHVTITGRFKEMIIRGGENIAPQAIETCIQKALPHLAYLQTQIVGAPDTIAGEVPVAIISETARQETRHEIQHAVVTNMGPAYAIDEVLTVTDLGLQNFPRTMAGKIQKVRLKELLQLRAEETPPNHSNGAEANGNLNLELRVRQILARAVGIDVEALSMNTELASIGDSISLMRFRDRINKRIGQNLSMEDIAGARTVSNLIDRLKEPAHQVGVEEESRWTVSSRTPPTRKDMVHILGDIDQYRASRKLVTETIAGAGLGWEDVREVFPAYDFTQTQIENGAFERWSTKIGLVASNHSVPEMRSALLKTLANNPMESSFVAWNKDISPLHVIVDQKTEFLESRISRSHTKIASAESLGDLVLKDTNHNSLPGPLVYISLYHCQADNSSAAIFNMHHSVTDASFLQIILEDLDMALAGRALRPHIPYRSYCESLFALQASPAAQVACRYHANKLQGIQRHGKHVWPSMDSELLPEDGGPDGYIHLFSAAATLALCKRHSHLTPSLVLKAATALFLIHKSGHTHALFAHVEAARDSMPFMPATLAAAARLEASDVGGQLFQSVVNCISLLDAETTSAYLSRLQDEQEVQHGHCAAPWNGIRRLLDDESAAFFPEIAAWCMFNWLGTNYVGDKAFDHINIVSTATRRVIVPFVNNCALQRDKAGDQIMLHLRGSVFEVEELKEFAAQIEAITKWLVEENNQAVPIARFEAALKE